MIFYFIFFILINLIIYFKRDFLIRIFNVYDFPDLIRKKHQNKVSVFGGGIVLLNIFFLFLILIFNKNMFPEIISNNRDFFSFFILSVFVFIIGLLDDKLRIKNKTKFLSLLFCISSLLLINKDLVLDTISFNWIDREILLYNFGFIFTVFCILAFMNSFNFFDGIDLLCGIYSLIIFVIFIYLTKSFFFIPLVFSLILFCLLNYKKKLFLGDSGALLISYFISIIMIKFYKLNLLHSEQVVIILLIPILDNLRVFYERFINKKNILTPDNEHLHHLLMKKFSNLNTVMLIMSIIFIPYIISNFYSIFYTLIILQISVYFFLVVKFKRF